MKRLNIVFLSKNTGAEIHTQLERLLGGKAEVHSCHARCGIPGDAGGDLILFTSQNAYIAARPFIRPGVPFLIARRSINYHEIDKILAIPPGTAVLLVNDSRDSTRETISLLQALGIDHLEYHPYSPDLTDYPRLATAITPGEAELVPPCVRTVIDIKTRQVDFTTLVEILKQLSLLDEKANLLSATYIREIIELIKTTRQMATTNTRLTGQLQTIIDVVGDGIVALDENERVSVSNPAAEKLLGVARENILGQSAAGPGVSDRLKPLFAKGAGETEFFLRVGGRQLVVLAPHAKPSARTAGKVFILRDVTEIQRLEQELRRKTVAEQNYARYHFEDILGDSEILGVAKDLAHKMALSASPVLIHGESGTGKEIFAQSIHNTSPRKNGPFVAVNFAALSESLLESELFGYVDGAFTGAKKGGCPGLFEQAHKGTIFLDEIGDAPLSFQIKLLRVLQEKQVRRIGGSQVIPINIRVITASNKDLKELIRKGHFRQDLYYRLKVLTLKLPPLRERPQDIPVLARSLYRKYFRNNPPHPAEKYFELILPCFMDYDWPGNIRELQNVVEYLSTICPDDIALPRHLPEEFARLAAPPPGPLSSGPAVTDAIARLVSEANSANMPVGRRSLAAKLGLPESQVRQLINQMAAGGRLNVKRGSRGLEITPQ